MGQRWRAGGGWRCATRGNYNTTGWIPPVSRLHLVDTFGTINLHNVMSWYICTRTIWLRRRVAVSLMIMRQDFRVCLDFSRVDKGGVNDFFRYWVNIKSYNQIIVIKIHTYVNGKINLISNKFTFFKFLLIFRQQHFSERSFAGLWFHFFASWCKGGC